MKRIALGTLGFLVMLSAAAEQRAPPQAHCIDARQIGGADGVTPSTLAVRLKNGQRFKVDLAQDCPAPESRLSVRGSKDGWLCAEPGESLVIGDAQCPISTIAPWIRAATPSCYASATDRWPPWKPCRLGPRASSPRVAFVAQRIIALALTPSAAGARARRGSPSKLHPTALPAIVSIALKLPAAARHWPVRRR